MDKMFENITDNKTEKKEERLSINPFPDIIDEDEFKKAKKFGESTINDFFKKRQDNINKDLDNDYFWSAYLAKVDLHDLSNYKITENYNQTIHAGNEALLSTANDEKINIVNQYFKNIESIDPEYNEELDPSEIYDCFKKDASGKTTIQYIAKKKAQMAAERMGSASFKDIIAMDTGVFVKSDNSAEINNPYSEKIESIKPTHTWMHKPNSEEEMEQMLRNISGKSIEIQTVIVVGYKILSNWERLYKTKVAEMQLPIKHLNENDIIDFAKEHFEEGRNIAGGVDYTSFGKEILQNPDNLNDENIYLLKGAPINDIRKLWAETQIIKRAAHIKIIKDTGKEDEDN